MNDLISRSALIEAMNGRFIDIRPYVMDNLAEGFVQMEKLIKEQPTVATPLSDCVGDCKSCWKTKLVNKPTVEPVHGEWIVHEWKEAKKGLVEPSLLLAKYECSRCHYLFENNSNFCPNCGADMRGEKND